MTQLDFHYMYRYSTHSKIFFKSFINSISSTFKHYLMKYLRRGKNKGHYLRLCINKKRQRVLELTIFMLYGAN